MKFLVDMALSPAIASWLRLQGHDAVHADDLGMHQSSDAEILRVAAESGRIVITVDLDFPRLLAALGTEGPGLILLRGGNYSEQQSLDCVRRVLMSVTPEDLPRSIVVVESRANPAAKTSRLESLQNVPWRDSVELRPRRKVVEAAGVEPASEKVYRRKTTCVSGSLIFVRLMRNTARERRLSLIVFGWRLQTEAFGLLLQNYAPRISAGP